LAGHNPAQHENRWYFHGSAFPLRKKRSKKGFVQDLDDVFPHDLDMGQNPIPMVNTKIAGKWMFIPLKWY